MPEILPQIPVFMAPPQKKIYSQFHKTLPRFSLQMHLISVRFYEMGDRLKHCTQNPHLATLDVHYVTRDGGITNDR